MKSKPRDAALIDEDPEVSGFETHMLLYCTLCQSPLSNLYLMCKDCEKVICPQCHQEEKKQEHCACRLKAHFIRLKVQGMRDLVRKVRGLSGEVHVQQWGMCNATHMESSLEEYEL